MGECTALHRAYDAVRGRAAGLIAVIAKITATPPAPSGPCHVTRGDVYAGAATGFHSDLGHRRPRHRR